ncbi:MAG: hypothetical protein LUI07_01575 [Lachnospiraceae bacterium]|nr:hypothetical protein [Lachnospiraceae bacterium]
MRTRQLFKSSILMFFFQMLSYLASFAGRIIFIRTISTDYVGVRGLFSNILSVLSLSELGIGTVLTYAMYRPLAEHDAPKICALVQFYRRMYRYIAVFIGAAGLCLTPFLRYLINDCPDLPDLSFIYVLYLLNTVLSYINVYNQSVLNADQKYYVTSMCYSVFGILKSIAEIIVLVITHDFKAYLLVQLPLTVAANFCGSWLAKRAYPFLKTNRKYALTPDDSRSIKKNIFAMFHHQIGAKILNSTDNIIISRFVSLTAVAKGDSYNIFLSMINAIVNPLFSSLISSIGNLTVTADKKDSLQVFGILHFMAFWLYTLASAELLLLLTPFVELFTGEDYVFPFPTTLVLVINFYIVGIRKIPLLFKEAMGLLWQDRWKPIVEAILNIIISIFAALKWGTMGVYMGTAISMLSTSIWVEPYTLFHYGFHTSAKPFWKTNMSHIFVSIILVFISYETGLHLYQGNIYGQIMIRFLCGLLIPCFGILLLFRKSDSMKGMRYYILNVLRH